MKKEPSRTKENLRTPTASLRPGLYLVATPIGHLGDITARALETLSAADLVLCEDTRVTGQLLRHFGLSCPLAVYNDYSEHASHANIIAQIKEGRAIALVSDAGMPLISDPGYQLVQACHLAGVYVTSIPGPSAVLMALQLSGLPSDAFLFGGFLPTKTGDRQRRFKSFDSVPATLIFFERADRVVDSLLDAAASLRLHRAAVVRELTKLYEEVRIGSVDDLVSSLRENPIKGEVVLLLDPVRGAKEWAQADIDQLLRLYMAQMPVKEAAAAAAEDTGLAKRVLYNRALTLKEDM